MPRGELYIRIPKTGYDDWKDAYMIYGVSLDETAISKLMTPAPNKEAVENESDLQHGKRVVRNTDETKKAERNISLIINISAPDKVTFLTRYGKFCKEVLDKGFFDIKTSYQSDVIYRMTYIDCQQFSEYNMEIGKFTLNLNEPDPTNRDISDKWENE